MTDTSRYESLEAPLDDEERELMNPARWDWEHAEVGVPVSDPRIVLEIEITGREIARLEAAAQARSMSVHRFVKHAALACAAHDATNP